MNKYNNLNSNVIEKFWNNVIVKDDSVCWEWVGGLESLGYGKIYANGTSYKAHRISWVLHNGEIPEHDSWHGMCVCHTCDNRKCVNPAHLFLGTALDNNRDRQNKGHTIVPDNRGERQGLHKLTDEKVREIREKYVPWVYTQQMLADEYGVSASIISGVVNFKGWKHVV